jgi:hypothetical protein
MFVLNCRQRECLLLVSVTEFALLRPESFESKVTYHDAAQDCSPADMRAQNCLVNTQSRGFSEQSTARHLLDVPRAVLSVGAQSTSAARRSRLHQATFRTFRPVQSQVKTIPLSHFYTYLKLGAFPTPIPEVEDLGKVGPIPLAAKRFCLWTT